MALGMSSADSQGRTSQRSGGRCFGMKNPSQGKKLSIPPKNHVVKICKFNDERWHQLVSLSYDYKREYQHGLETTILVKHYTLPDGRVIKVSTERFQAPEALFTPEPIDVEGDGMADMVFLCIQEMDVDNRMSIYQHIVLSGGSTILEKEILDRYLEVVLMENKDGLKKLWLRIEDPLRRKHMVYVGGAALAGIMKDVPEFWISREDYLEEGISCLSKCGQA